MRAFVARMLNQPYLVSPRDHLPLPVSATFLALPPHMRRLSRWAPLWHPTYVSWPEGLAYPPGLPQALGTIIAGLRQQPASYRLGKALGGFLRLCRRWVNFSRTYLYAANAFWRPACYRLLQRSVFVYRGEPGAALYRAFCWSPSRWLQHYRFGGRGLPATPAPWYGSRRAFLFAPRANQRDPILFSRKALFLPAKAKAAGVSETPQTIPLAPSAVQARGH